MAIGEWIQSALESRRDRQRKRLAGAIGQYWRAGGNAQHFENLPLSSDDVVIDAGGYRGEWADQMLIRYGCSVVIFEPIPAFARQLRVRYALNRRVAVEETALSGKDGSSAMSVAADGSSLWRTPQGAERVTVKLVDAASVIRREASRSIGCLKLNIEGAEYDVLERLAEQQLFHLCRALLIQFHNFEHGSATRRKAIQEHLAHTHTCKFDYPFVWEMWIRKE